MIEEEYLVLSSSNTVLESFSKFMEAHDYATRLGKRNPSQTYKIAKVQRVFYCESTLKWRDQ